MKREHILALLKWGAGARVLSGEPSEIEEDELLSFVDAHRLTVRFLARLLKEQPPWATPSLIRKLQLRQLHIRYDFHQKIGALREVQAACRSSGLQLAIVKGLSSYSLTGEPSMIRYVGDFDVLAGDPEELVTVLSHLGYEVKGRGGHTVADMGRQDLSFDIHKFFPVDSYPRPMDIGGLLPRLHPGLWLKSVGEIATRNEITYDEIIKNSTTGILPENTDITVPDTNMTILVSCAHIFRHYLEQAIWQTIYRLGAGTLRLGDLADIRDLALHPRFNSARFLELTRKYNGGDSVDLVSFLLATYFGRSPLPTLSLAGFRFRNRYYFPRPLWPHRAFWLTDDRPADNILLPETSVESVVRWIGGDTVIAAANVTHRTYNNSGSWSSGRISRVVSVQAENGRQLALEIRLSWSQLTFTLEVCILEDLGQHNVKVSTVIGDGNSSFWEYLAFRDRVQTSGVIGKASLNRQDGRFTVGLSFPWNLLAGFSSIHDRVPLLITVASEGVAHGDLAAIIVPLNVVRNSG